MRGVTEAGTPDQPAIVFLHGGVINRNMWLPVMAELEGRFHLVAVDIPGHGDLQDQRFDLESSVERVIDVMDEANIEKAVQVGLSLGGYVAQAVASVHPERVDGLVLSGATIRYTGWDGWSTRLYGYAMPLLARPAKRAFAKQLRASQPEYAEPILAGGLAMNAGGRALRVLPGRDYAEEMSGYSGPIVIANGERDTDNRDHEKYFKEHFPDATFVVIDDAGHACAVQQPSAFAAVVDQLMSEVT